MAQLGVDSMDLKALLTSAADGIERLIGQGAPALAQEAQAHLDQIRQAAETAVDGAIAAEPAPLQGLAVDEEQLVHDGLSLLEETFRGKLGSIAALRAKLAPAAT